MRRTMLRVKIHRAVVTEADLNYVGSMTIPKSLMKELDILEGEQLDVVNINTGARWTTYAIPGEQDGHYGLNGAAARLGAVGDRVIIMVYAELEDAECRKHRIRIAHISDDNKVAKIETH
ncbi:MAG: aspartate 1-decarboxylase [Planctomycetes bacterium]|nr:aspartate 1-decarboxylase [Planctomycetota bacterium]